MGRAAARAGRSAHLDPTIRGTREGQQVAMDVVEPPVSTGLILICDKCGKRMKADFDENPSRELVARLKKASKDVFAKGQVRAALTSCLDICPDNQISVAIVPTAGHTE